ncbi:hypothetical protein FRC20_011658 [Serendipita sp. 405]|nr:hypothetical protein FRC15_011682 [Serendipita sp. 397]KAG8877292.1 hypothetical protein FRC20_011658 [Serendipita sp. 405]
MNTNAAVNAHVGVGGGLLATSSTLAAGSAGNVEFGSFTSASTSTGFSSIGTGSTSATNVPFEPTIRSRTLFFLSIRDSRAPSFHRNKRKRIDDATITGASGTKKSREGEPFVIYDEEEEEEDDTERGRLLGSNVKSPSGHITIDVQQGPGLPPAWVELADQVERTLQAVRGKITTLDKLHTKHALPGFADRSAEERDIERMTTDITRLLPSSYLLASILEIAGHYDRGALQDGMEGVKTGSNQARRRWANRKANGSDETVTRDYENRHVQV